MTAQASILVMVNPKTVFVNAFLLAFAAERLPEKKINALSAMKNNKLSQESIECG